MKGIIEINQEQQFISNEIAKLKKVFRDVVDKGKHLLDPSINFSINEYYGDGVPQKINIEVSIDENTANDILKEVLKTREERLKILNNLIDIANNAIKEHL